MSRSGLTGNRSGRALRSLGLGSLAGSTIYGAAIVAAHLLRPDQNLLQVRLSHYAIGPWSAILTTGFLAHGLGLLSLALAFRMTLRGSMGRAGPLLLGLGGLGVLMVGLFPTDPLGAPVTTVGIVHGVGAWLSFATSTATTVVVSLSLKDDDRWQGWRTVLLPLAVAIAGSLAVHVSGFGPSGLTQKTTIVLIEIWMVLAALRVVRLAAN